MVVSHHRESSISSNIRAIIEQLNLNPVERRRLIESRTDEAHCKSHVVDASSRPRVTIGVYGQIHQQKQEFIKGIKHQDYIKKLVEEKSSNNILVEQQQQQRQQEYIKKLVEEKSRDLEQQKQKQQNYIKKLVEEKSNNSILVVEPQQKQQDYVKKLVKEKSNNNILEEQPKKHTDYVKKLVEEKSNNSILVEQHQKQHDSVKKLVEEKSINSILVVEPQQKQQVYVNKFLEEKSNNSILVEQNKKQQDYVHKFLEEKSNNSILVEQNKKQQDYVKKFLEEKSNNSIRVEQHIKPQDYVKKLVEEKSNNSILVEQHIKPQDCVKKLVEEKSNNNVLLEQHIKPQDYVKKLVEEKSNNNVLLEQQQQKKQQDYIKKLVEEKSRDLEEQQKKQQEYIKKLVDEKSNNNFLHGEQPRVRNVPRKIEPRPRQRIPPRLELEEILKKDATTSPTNNNNDALLPPPPASPLKEDLPEITNGVLNHDAALHRISVRPKNRRPPRRATPTSSNNSSLNTSNGNLNSTTSTNGLPRIDSASEISIDTLDSLEGTLPPETAQPSTPIPQEQPPSPSSPVVPSKPIPILRKSSSRLSRNSEVFEELEAKLRKPPVSPDSLDIKDHLDSSRTSADVLEVGTEVVKPPKPSPRTASVSSDDRVMTPITASSPSDRRRRVSSNRLSKSPDSLEGTSPGWFTKSNEGFDKLLSEYDRNSTASNTSLVNLNTSTVSVNRDQKPVAAARKLLVKPISKSQERVCCTKSSDSLEALEASDDSMERRRSSFEIRNRRVMSKSTECFDSSLIEHQQQLIAAKAEEKRKRASVSEMNLSRGGNRHSKVLSKSSESFEAISNLVESHFEKSTPAETEKPQNVWRVNRRITNSSESSDNLDLEENCKLENRNKQVRRSNPKRLSTGSANMNFSVDVADQDSSTVLSRKPPSRLQKSSESSELGSTDTLDSERRNTLKSSDSDETLDSLEKDLQESPDRKDDEDWRRRASSQENLDIQLLAYTLVSKVIQENGNSHHEVEEQRNDKNNHEEKTEETSHQVAYPKKKLQLNQQSSSSEDNKINLSSTFNNLLSSTKNDEDLQNMLNGNISEVSTESTKSFKEKLIMFEKLGK